MQIAPVNYLTHDPPLEYLVVVRASPSGEVDRLRVSPTFEVQVERRDGRTHQYRLEASEAEDLLHALGELAATPHHSSTGVPPYRFDVELGWRGHTVALRGIELPGAGDDAVAGVLDFATTAFDHRLEPGAMTERRIPATA